MEVQAYITTNEPIDGLYVRADLFGREHRIAMPIGLVTIQLPQAAHPYGGREGRVDDPEDNWYEASVLSVRVDLATPITFDGTEEQFNSNVSSAAFDSSRSKFLTELEGALDLWRRTLSWVALSPAIGVAHVRSERAYAMNRGFLVRRLGDGKQFYGHGGTITAEPSAKVDARTWDATQAALDAGAAPPLWMDYLFDAHRHVSVQDYRSAVISSAIAAETVIRATFQATLPPISSPVASDALEALPVSRLLGKWGSISGWAATVIEAQGKSAAQDLFTLRNKVLHSGTRSTQDLMAVVDLLPGVSRFVLAADRSLTQRSGSTDWTAPHKEAEPFLVSEWRRRRRRP